VPSWKEVYLKLHSYHKEKENFYLKKVKDEFDMVSLICDRLGNSISHFYKRGAFYGQEPNELFNFTTHAADLFSFSTRIGFRECIKYFIEWNLISDKFVSRSLDVSIRRNKFDVVKVVIESIDYVDWLESRELIFWVIEMNFVEMMETLIEKGINIHRSRLERESPLCYASMKKRFEITKMLVENGADLNKAKGLPLMYAVENKDTMMISYYLETKTLKLEVIENALKKAEETEDNLQVSSLLVSEIAERELIERNSL
jgi:Ankyrin repeat.